MPPTCYNRQPVAKIANRLLPRGRRHSDGGDKRESCQELCETVEKQVNTNEKWRRKEVFITEVRLNTIDKTKEDLSAYFALEKPKLSRKLRGLARECLTKAQYDVFRLLLQGMTESEIASELGKSRPTIHTTLHGSSVGRGGIIRKLKKKCS